VGTSDYNGPQDAIVELDTNDLGAPQASVTTLVNQATLESLPGQTAGQVDPVALANDGVDIFTIMSSWPPSSSNDIIRVTPAGAASIYVDAGDIVADLSTQGYTTGIGANGITVDGEGHVWFLNPFGEPESSLYFDGSLIQITDIISPNGDAEGYHVIRLEADLGLSVVPPLSADSLVFDAFNGRVLFTEGESDSVVAGSATDSLLMQNPPFAIDLAEVGVGSVPGIQITGIAMWDFLGYGVGSRSLAPAGDINDDGIMDFLLGAPQFLTSPERPGEVYLIFGSVDGIGSGGTLDLSALDGSNGVTVPGLPGDLLMGSCGAGDINGDSIDDFLIYSYGTSTGSGTTVYLICGNASFGASGSFDLSTLNGTNGIVINGASHFAGRIGGDITGVGDFNGDGVDDFAMGFANEGDTGVGSPNYDGTGAAYLIYGSTAGIGSGETLDITDINGDQNADGHSDGVRFSGGTANDHIGIYVERAGDVNGDGLDDLMISDKEYDITPSGNEGVVYLIWGSTSPIGSSGEVDLNALGSLGVRIEGISPEDIAGGPLRSGDFNADGVSDLLIGAVNAGPYLEGESYLVYGSTAGIGSGGTLSLADLALDNNTDGSPDGVLIHGAKPQDCSGLVGGGGDFNGDGFIDLLIGAVEGVTDAGEAALIYGTGSGIGIGGVFGLSDLDGTNGTLFTGENHWDFAGHSNSSVGDINADGIDDFAISASNYGHSGVGSLDGRGRAYVVFGQEEYESGTGQTHCIAGNAQPRPLMEIRVVFDYPDGSGPGVAGASLETATVTRTDTGITNLGDGTLADVADVRWEISTDRTGWTSADVTFQYTPAEVAGLNAPTLRVHQSLALSGPWTEVAVQSHVVTHRQITATVTSFSHFAILGALGQTTAVGAWEIYR
jgi:FG-GAP repeat